MRAATWCKAEAATDRLTFRVHGCSTPTTTDGSSSIARVLIRTHPFLRRPEARRHGSSAPRATEQAVDVRTPAGAVRAGGARLADPPAIADDPADGDPQGAAVERLRYASEVVPTGPSSTALMTRSSTIQRSIRLLTKSEVMFTQVPLRATTRVVWCESDARITAAPKDLPTRALSGSEVPGANVGRQASVADRVPAV